MNAVVFGVDVAVDSVLQRDSISSLKGDGQLVRHLARLAPPVEVYCDVRETNVYNIGGFVSERQFTP
jgi:hypothetical protein